MYPVRSKRKYGNKPTSSDGVRFDSKKEAQRYGLLKMRLAAGEITNLSMQHRFPLKAIGGQKIAEYRADFYYFDCVLQKWVIEDVKSEVTAKDRVYRLKKRWMAAQGLEIVEV